MSHLASRIQAVLAEQRAYVLWDVDTPEVTAREVRTIIQTHYQVPATQKISIHSIIPPHTASYSCTRCAAISDRVPG